MPATPDRNPLQHLLDTRHDLWRGRMPPAPTALGSGDIHLDRQLPAGGWPCGRITELVPDAFGLGELKLLLPALAAQTSRGLPVVLTAPPMVPCPQALAAAGVDLARLVIVRQPGQALWAAEQCLKSGLCGAIVIWPPGKIQPRAIRRLQLAAENGAAPAFICYRPGQPPPPSLATLRLAIHPGPAVEILRAGGGTTGRILQLEASNIISLQRHRSS